MVAISSTVVQVSPVLSTIASAFMGALFGAIGTLLVQRHLADQDRSERADKIRRALISELESMAPFTKQFSEPSRGAEFTTGIATPRTVFESVVGEIGLLSEEEVEAVVEFYSLITVLDNMGRAAASGGRLHPMEQPPSGLAGTAEDRRVTAVELVDKHLSSNDSTRGD